MIGPSSFTKIYPNLKNKISLIDSDGAAALVLVSGEKAIKLGLQVIAKISGYADAAQVFHKIYADQKDKDDVGSGKYLFTFDVIRTFI